MRTAFWLLVLASVMSATAVARQPPIESAATVRQLDEAMVKPASDVVFNVRREAARRVEQWTAISRAGVTLVKSW